MHKKKDFEPVNLLNTGSQSYVWQWIIVLRRTCSRVFKSRGWSFPQKYMSGALLLFAGSSASPPPPAEKPGFIPTFSERSQRWAIAFNTSDFQLSVFGWIAWRGTQRHYLHLPSLLRPNDLSFINASHRRSLCRLSPCRHSSRRYYPYLKGHL